ncbi:MAG: hypothetical protein WBD84_01945 [Methyloceanibacter sp.]|jgi:hypothetical protein
MFEGRQPAPRPGFSGARANVTAKSQEGKPLAAAVWKATPQSPIGISQI